MANQPSNSRRRTGPSAQAPASAAARPSRARSGQRPRPAASSADERRSKAPGHPPGAARGPRGGPGTKGATGTRDPGAGPSPESRSGSAAAGAGAALGPAPVGAWLLKSEPEVFSFSDLLASPGRRTGWDGVRNYQARNFMRDRMQLGDLVLYYHSNSAPPALVGTARVVALARPDPTQFDPRSAHFDPDSDPAQPRWLEVEIEAERALPRPVTLEQLRAEPRLAGLQLLARGNRLSVLPVSPEHLGVILELAQASPAPPRQSQKSAKSAPPRSSPAGSRAPGRPVGGDKT